MRYQIFQKGFLFLKVMKKTTSLLLLHLKKSLMHIMKFQDLKMQAMTLLN